MTHSAMSFFVRPIDENLNIGQVEQTVTSGHGKNMSGWNYWQDYYYPEIIRTSYPVYIQERSQDKGKKAFEIIKALQDKKLIKLDKVSDFVDAMDELIKIL